MGRTSRQDTGRTGKAGHGQDGQEWFMGRTDVLLKWAGHKKLDANSSGLSPGLDARTMNGSAQSEIILSGHLNYKLARLLDSSRTRAILRTVMAHPGCQRPNNWIHGQDWTYRASCIGYHGLTRTPRHYRIRLSNQEGQFLCNRLYLSRILGWYHSFVGI